MIFFVNMQIFYGVLLLVGHVWRIKFGVIWAQAEFMVHAFSAEAAEPLNMVGMGASPCNDEGLLFDCGRSRTSVMRYKHGLWPVPTIFDRLAVCLFYQ